MYYPILRGKRHELNAISKLASLPISSRCRPLLEPVNTNVSEIAACINELQRRGITPYVVINPNLGDYLGQISNITHLLQQNPLSSGKFFPCIKIQNSFDISAINLLQNHPNAAAYLVSDISAANLQNLANTNCIFANPARLDPQILSALPRLVVYADAFAKQRRNADYPQSSFYSTLHFNYTNYPNTIGVGDFTIMGEDYSDAGGPAYVVAIHASYLPQPARQSLYVRHFCSTMQPASPANPGGKFLQALNDLIAFDLGNPLFFDRTWGLLEFHAYHNQQHYPGLGVVKELSVEHHIETICNFI